MRKLLFLILPAGLLLAMPWTVATGADWFAPYAWQNRHILVFSPTDHDQRLQSLRDDLRVLDAEVVDRRLLLWEVVPGASVRVDGKVSGIAGDPLRSEFQVAPGDFAVILIGYDGEEKLRQERVDLPRIFGEVDRMPIRRMEMEQVED